jgi:phosphoglucomutase
MVHELAGKRAPNSVLVNIPGLVSAYYTDKPDVSKASEPGAKSYA